MFRIVTLGLNRRRKLLVSFSLKISVLVINNGRRETDADADVEADFGSAGSDESDEISRNFPTGSEHRQTDSSHREASNRRGDTRTIRARNLSETDNSDTYKLPIISTIPYTCQ